MTTMSRESVSLDELSKSEQHELIPTDWVGDILGVTVGTVRSYLADGRLTGLPVRTGKGRPRVHVTLESLLAHLNYGNPVSRKAAIRATGLSGDRINNIVTNDTSVGFRCRTLANRARWVVDLDALAPYQSKKLLDDVLDEFEDLIGTREAADIIGIRQPTVIGLVTSGALRGTIKPAETGKGNRYMVSRLSAQKYAEARKAKYAAAVASDPPYTYVLEAVDVPEIAKKYDASVEDGAAKQLLATQEEQIVHAYTSGVVAGHSDSSRRILLACLLMSLGSALVAGGVGYWIAH